jgi:hypothetical protein
MKYQIIFDNNDIQAIKSAERQKTMYENKGYNLLNTKICTTGLVQLTYLERL